MQLHPVPYSSYDNPAVDGTLLQKATDCTTVTVDVPIRDQSVVLPADCTRPLIVLRSRWMYRSEISRWYYLLIVPGH
jgi:hypothetical protein